MISTLDFSNVPSIVGNEPIKFFKQGYKIIKRTNWLVSYYAWNI
jgi:hypothetical protein